MFITIREIIDSCPEMHVVSLVVDPEFEKVKDELSIVQDLIKDSIFSIHDLHMKLSLFSHITY